MLVTFVLFSMEPLEQGLNNALSPTAAGERLVLLDNLRGFAILGILLVNFASFAWPYERQITGPLVPEPWIDVLANGLIAFFAKGKFVTLFSFLFGVGLAIQQERCLANQRNFTNFAMARMGVLLPIGLAHGLLLWHGDILAIYAMAGFILLFVLRLETRHLLPLAGLFLALYLLTIVFYTLTDLLAWLMPSLVPEMATYLQEVETIYLALYLRTQEILLSGDLLQGIALRKEHLAGMYEGINVWGWVVLANFTLGAWAWRSGLLRRISINRPFFEKVLTLGLIVGVPANLILALVSQSKHVGLDMIYLLSEAVGQFGFCAAMIAFFAMRFSHATPLAAVGRMALTNYLIQSLFFTTVFYGHGLGLLGHIGAASGLLMSFSFFVIQIWASRRWLDHFQQGPMEWLWRKATYGLFAILPTAKTDIL